MMGGGNFPQNNSRPPDKRSYASAAAGVNKDVLKNYHEEVLVAKMNRNKIEIMFVNDKNDDISVGRLKYVCRSQNCI